ncbi:MAG TPA: MoxR family ATPase, partial [Desulfobacteraceae bacterium]|nr:MoxR family ATPase [Desulfobacteraceae bacterium]
GVGKTTLAYHAGRSLNKPVYLFQATMDTRPEDLIVTPVISEGGKIKYMASSIVSAMIKGGVAIIDEGNRMSEKSWASLAPLLDNRRYVESVVAGIKIKAHPEFRLCTTMNDDASTFELPEYIHSRLQPQIYIDFPEREEELLILSKNLPFADDEILEYVVEFLQAAHDADERYSVRDGINIARYAMKRVASLNQPKEVRENGVVILNYLKEAASLILDEGATTYFNEILDEMSDEQ